MRNPLSRIALAALSVIGCVGVALAANVLNYHEQGGDRWVVGGELVIDDGGTLTIAVGGTIDNEGDALAAVDFDEDYFVVESGEVTLGDAVAKGTAVANIAAVPEDLSDSANGAAIAAAVNGNAAAINDIIAALEEFGIALPD